MMLSGRKYNERETAQSLYLLRRYYVIIKRGTNNLIAEKPGHHLKSNDPS